MQTIIKMKISLLEKCKKLWNEKRANAFFWKYEEADRLMFAEQSIKSTQTGSSPIASESWSSLPDFLFLEKVCRVLDLKKMF